MPAVMETATMLSLMNHLFRSKKKRVSLMMLLSLALTLILTNSTITLSMKSDNVHNVKGLDCSTVDQMESHLVVLMSH